MRIVRRRRRGIPCASAASPAPAASLFLSAVLRKREERQRQYARQSDQQTGAISHVELLISCSRASVDVPAGGYYFLSVGGDRLGSIHNSDRRAGLRREYTQRDLVARHKHLS